MDQRIDNQTKQIAMMLKSKRNNDDSIYQTPEDIKIKYEEKINKLNTIIEDLKEENLIIKSNIEDIINNNKKKSKADDSPKKSTGFRNTSKYAEYEYKIAEIREQNKKHVENLEEKILHYIKYEKENDLLKEENQNLRIECDAKDDKMNTLEKDMKSVKSKLDNSVVPASKLECELNDLKISHNNVLLVFYKFINDATKFSQSDITLKDTELIFHNNDMKELLINRIET